MNKPRRWPVDFVDQVLCGNCLEILPDIPDSSIQCCVTSPPYWGLRDYGVEGQLGLEKTPEEYTTKLVEVFREVRRVLKDDGTLWLNIGDCYAGKSGGARDPERWPKQSRNDHATNHAKSSLGVKHKDLIGIPWRVAFALQADGWYLRSEIVWSKTNSMPESVLDRPSASHEKIFLLAKSPLYYYDVDSLREPYKASSLLRKKSPNTDTGARFQSKQPGARDRAEETRTQPPNPLGKNLTTVWDLPAVHSNGHSKHFAAFPEKIPERCILAGSRDGDIILDPFLGTGTTGKRAKELGRKWIGIDLKPAYCKIAEELLSQLEIFRNGPDQQA